MTSCVRLLLQAQMFLPDLRRGEDAHERRRRRRLLDRRTSAGLFALDQADDTGHLEAELARRVNGLDGRSAGGADIVHDHDLCALLAEAFDALLHAVGLFRLAHEETVDV